MEKTKILERLDYLSVKIRDTCFESIDLDEKLKDSGLSTSDKEKIKKEIEKLNNQVKQMEKETADLFKKLRDIQ